jgi:hypothetical protein
MNQTCLVNPAYHQFLVDENRMLRNRLLDLQKERHQLEDELFDLRIVLGVNKTHVQRKEQQLKAKIQDQYMYITT